MFVCLSVGMWRADGNPNPSTDLNKILHTHPHLSKKGFGTGLTPTPFPTWAWGPETLWAEGHIFLQNKRCFAGCKLSRAAPGTSASLKIKSIFFLWDEKTFNNLYCTVLKLYDLMCH